MLSKSRRRCMSFSNISEICKMILLRRLDRQAYSSVHSVAGRVIRACLFNLLCPRDEHRNASLIVPRRYYHSLLGNAHFQSQELFQGLWYPERYPLTWESAKPKADGNISDHHEHCIGAWVALRSLALYPSLRLLSVASARRSCVKAI